MANLNERYVLSQVILEVCEKTGVSLTTTMTYYEVFEKVASQLHVEILNEIITTIQKIYPNENEIKNRHLTILQDCLLRIE